MRPRVGCEADDISGANRMFATKPKVCAWVCCGRGVFLLPLRRARGEAFEYTRGRFSLPFLCGCISISCK
ncbi:MAG: hypothetical protein M0P20_04315, partial [Methanocorpusculum sp.]|nr:hypothetical protein [Methanocorpusculum sp.]